MNNKLLIQLNETEKESVFGGGQKVWTRINGIWTRIPINSLT